MLKRMLQSGWKGNGITIDQIKETYISMKLHGLKKLYPGSQTKFTRADVVGEGTTFEVKNSTEFAFGYETISKGPYRLLHNRSQLQLDKNKDVRFLDIYFAGLLKIKRMIIK